MESAWRKKNFFSSNIIEKNAPQSSKNDKLDECVSFSYALFLLNKSPKKVTANHWKHFLQ